MSRAVVSVTVAIVVGVALVFLAPAAWFTWAFGAALASSSLFAIIVRVDTKTEPPANPLAAHALSALNLPDQPLAEVKGSWALTSFFASVALALSLGLAVIVRAYA